MDKSTFVDFKGLNHACPKDDFSLQTIELMVNATIGQEALSSVEGSSRYNQTGMTPKDKELTTFCIPKSIYHYKVMPFKI